MKPTARIIPTAKRRRISLVLAAALIVPLVACGNAAVLFLNPSFVNQAQGGLFPLVPRPGADLLFVRVVNTTTESMTFLVTIETATRLDNDEASGAVILPQTTELFTTPGSQSNEAGILFDCFDDAPIIRVGLGRNLNQPSTDTGLFVGTIGDIQQGFGVPANINPLNSQFGDFSCGDTVIFQSIESTNTAGGFKVLPFVIRAETQPTDTVRNTFQVAADFLRDRIGQQ